MRICSMRYCLCLAYAMRYSASHCEAWRGTISNSSHTCEGRVHPKHGTLPQHMHWVSSRPLMASLFVHAADSDCRGYYIGP